jgi:hypothetical protein
MLKTIKVKNKMAISAVKMVYDKEKMLLNVLVKIYYLIVYIQILLP